MIGKGEFLDMKMDDMVETLYRDGTFMVSIRYYAYKINLYLLSDFYVEVFYSHKYDKIERVELLQRKTKRIKFYADQIRLPANLLA